MSKPKPAQDENGRFITGNCGGGRRKGSRNKLGEAFLSALQDDFQENGVAAIERVRMERPDAYIKALVQLMPRVLEVDDTSELTDEQLDARIRQIVAILHRSGVIDEGMFGSDGGSPTSESAH